MGRICLMTLLTAALGCTGRTGSSTSSSSGHVPSSYGEWCRDYLTALCVPPQCDTGEPFDQARCVANANHSCERFGSDFEVQAAAGRAVFHGDSAAQCTQQYISFFTLLARYQCDPTDPEALAAVYRLFGLDQACDNGVPFKPDAGLFTSCNNVVEGLVPAGGSCATQDVCVDNAPTCMNRPDGGCGVCAGTDAGGSVSEVPVGGQCRIRLDGGTTQFLTCSAAGKCNTVTGICEPYVHSGEPCGNSSVCSGTCGLHCSSRDGGTCVPHSGANQPCDYAAGDLCQPGTTCALNVNDAGNPSYTVGICRPNVELSQPCSTGYNYDNAPAYAAPSMQGGYSFGPLGMCTRGLSCSVPDGGGRTGVCTQPAPTARVETGSACTGSDVCAHRVDRCRDADAGRVCLRRGDVGAPCTASDDCLPTTWCSSVDGGAGLCSAELDDGTACERSGQCHTYSVCDHGICISGELSNPDPVNQCL